MNMNLYENIVKGIRDFTKPVSRRIWLIRKSCQFACPWKTNSENTRDFHYNVWKD